MANLEKRVSSHSPVIPISTASWTLMLAHGSADFCIPDQCTQGGGAASLKRVGDKGETPKEPLFPILVFRKCEQGL